MAVPAIFLDRDGTLMEEVNYCNDPSQVKVYPGAAEALAKVRAAGFRTIIITNQAGIARGKITGEQFRAVQTEFFRQLGADLIDACYVCADHPDTPSARRKPEPGMLLEAAAEHDLDLAKSWCIGDKVSDIESGRRAGVRTILVRTGYGATPEHAQAPADFAVRDVIAAIQLILGES
jgi:D-glycero-D-manno-heptose 1,7-bisphosphate phosphatase